ncbi:hypothetical protein ACTFIZ_009395 [Dictyostelium cf. discoideum]
MRTSKIPHNVTSLKFSPFKSKIESNSLFISIETLDLGNNETSFPQVSLPPTITNLPTTNSKRYALPQNLKSFYFKGYCFKQLPDLIWPPSFKFIYIHGDSLDFINSIPTHFFTKHVELIRIKFS